MFTTRPEISGTFGVVASTHWLASAVGMAMLEKGGNAFDAAVAAGFTLQVVEPHMNGPGGEVSLLLYDAGKDEVSAVCGQGTVPAAATIERFRELGLDLVPGTGLLAAVVPGAFDAWMQVLRDFGTFRIADVLEPAIGYARNGYPVVARISTTIETVRDLFETEWKSSAAVYLRNGAVPPPGSLFRNPNLADTFERILREAESAGPDRDAQIEAARRSWYEGFVAETIDRFCAATKVMDTSGRRHCGLLSGSDMARWQASVEKPVTYDYHRYTVVKTGPWGQGPVFLQELALLKGFDLGAMDPTGPDFVHTVVECAKLAFADREVFYGDPDFVDVPLKVLLGDEYNDARRPLIGAEASWELRPGEILGHGGPIDYRVATSPEDEFHVESMGAGEPTRFGAGEMRGDTCHVDVIDRNGNMVAATPSGGWLQGSPVVPGLGFCLGTRAQMFWLKEGGPASLVPGKRPRTTLSPSLALRDGEPYMAFGTPGGDHQDQWSLIFFLRHIHFGLNLQEAIELPMFHTAHFPSSFYPRVARPGQVTVESRFAAHTVAELRRRGHDVEVDEDWSLGRLSAAAKEGKRIMAAANPRFMQGYAVGR